MQQFYHIVDGDEWRQAQATGSYSPPSLAAEGFIHCSYPAQVLMPANRLFRGHHNLVLLRIDPARVRAEIRLEPVEVLRAGILAVETFPHIYGPLNADAVVAVIPFPAGPDGGFVLPAGLGE